MNHHTKLQSPLVTGGQPLYLHHSSAVRLDVDLSQRLCIERKSLPMRHIPMRYVSRIVCNSSLDISSAALMACMKAGIPLAVVDNAGDTLGWCIGARRKESSLQHLLVHALDDPECAKYFSAWRETHYMATSAQNLLLCGVSMTPQARQNPRAALCNAHYQKHRQPCAKALNALSQLAQHELSAQLAVQVGDVDLLAWTIPGFNLIRDLGELLGLHAHIDIHHALLLPAQEDLKNWALRHYEHHSAHWQQRIGHLMFAFEKFLRTHWL